MNGLVKIMVAIMVIVGLATFGSMSVAAQESPNAWTENVCAGGAAIVYQGPDEQGDGVTISTNTDQPDENRDGCDQSTALAWLVVEPWGNGQFNADAACVVGTWQEVGVFANRMSWLNGSAWRVERAHMDNHPMVVSCSSVYNPDDMGLNPNERQIEPERQQWVMDRAQELAEGNLSSYCSEYGSEPLARLVCGAYTPAQNQPMQPAQAADPEQPNQAPGEVPGDGAQDGGGQQPPASGQIFDPIAWLNAPSFAGFATNLGLIDIIALIAFLIWLWRRSRRNRKANGQQGIVNRIRRGNHGLSIKTESLPSGEAGKSYSTKITFEGAHGITVGTVEGIVGNVTISGNEATLSWDNPVEGTHVITIVLDDESSAEPAKKRYQLVINKPSQQPLTAEDVLRIMRERDERFRPPQQPEPAPAPQPVPAPVVQPVQQAPELDYNRLAEMVVAKMPKPATVVVEAAPVVETKKPRRRRSSNAAPEAANQ